MSEPATTLTLYGIPACDTLKKARAWLNEHRIAYRFHNYKTSGITAERLAAWCRVCTWQRLLNRSGTTFRGLDPAQKQDLDQPKAIALMLAHPSLIKRPLLEYGHDLYLIGFDPQQYTKLVLPLQLPRP